MPLLFLSDTRMTPCRETVTCRACKTRGVPINLWCPSCGTRPIAGLPDGLLGQPMAVIARFGFTVPKSSRGPVGRLQSSLRRLTGAATIEEDADTPPFSPDSVIG